MDIDGPVSIGELAKVTSTKVVTIRYYERIGLVGGVARTSGGRRIFTDDDIGWLEILRCLRDTGMPIARMLRSLSSLSITGLPWIVAGLCCGHVAAEAADGQ